MTLGLGGLFMNNLLFMPLFVVFLQLKLLLLTPTVKCIPSKALWLHLALLNLELKVAVFPSSVSYCLSCIHTHKQTHMYAEPSVACQKPSRAS